jgi:hypothetical protein
MYPKWELKKGKLNYFKDQGTYAHQGGFSWRKVFKENITSDVSCDVGMGF